MQDALWTHSAVRDLIHQQFGVKLSTRLSVTTSRVGLYTQKPSAAKTSGPSKSRS
jgi:hypothetical protein